LRCSGTNLFIPFIFTALPITQGLWAHKNDLLETGKQELVIDGEEAKSANICQKASSLLAMFAGAAWSCSFCGSWHF
jgi:hypothetical protein